MALSSLVLAAVLAAVALARPIDDPVWVTADPNVHTLTIPSSASGKVLGFNYGEVPCPSYKLPIICDLNINFNCSPTAQSRLLRLTWTARS
jgi:hypothetical protein